MPFILLLLLLLAIPVTAIAGEAPYSAIVMDFKGKVEVQRDRKKMPVDLGYLLYAGDKVETAKGASLTINYLESGQEEKWPGLMKFTVDKLGSRPSLATVVKKNKKIVLPRLEHPQSGVFRLRSMSANLRVPVKDLSNTCILDERPLFRWGSVNSADRYQLTLYLFDGNKLLWQKTSAGPEMPYPADAPPLKAGSRYTWDVEAIRDDRIIAAKRSCFYIPKKKEFNDINQQMISYQQQLASNPGDTVSRLDLIFFLENSRLYQYALEQYDILRKLHGESESLKQREENLIHLIQSDCTLEDR